MSQKANNLIERLKSELSIKKDKDLCHLLGIKHNTLSTWKKRDTLDFNKILELCENHNLDLNYIFFEEEKIMIEENAESPADFESSKFIKENVNSRLNHFYSTSLVNTNRHIAVFYNQILEESARNIGEIIICQKVSIQKIIENTLYILEDDTNKFYLDKVLFMNDKDSKNSRFYLNEYDRKIEAKSIVNAWEVLENKSDVLQYIDRLKPL